MALDLEPSHLTNRVVVARDPDRALFILLPLPTNNFSENDKCPDEWADVYVQKQHVDRRAANHDE